MSDIVFYASDLRKIPQLKHCPLARMMHTCLDGQNLPPMEALTTLNHFGSLTDWHPIFLLALYAEKFNLSIEWFRTLYREIHGTGNFTLNTDAIAYLETGDPSWASIYIRRLNPKPATDHLFECYVRVYEKFFWPQIARKGRTK